MASLQNKLVRVLMLRRGPGWPGKVLLIGPPELHLEFFNRGPRILLPVHANSRRVRSDRAHHVFRVRSLGKRHFDVSPRNRPPGVIFGIGLVVVVGSQRLNDGFKRLELLNVPNGPFPVAFRLRPGRKR